MEKGSEAHLKAVITRQVSDYMEQQDDRQVADNCETLSRLRVDLDNFLRDTLYSVESSASAACRAARPSGTPAAEAMEEEATAAATAIYLQCATARRPDSASQAG